MDMNNHKQAGNNCKSTEHHTTNHKHKLSEDDSDDESLKKAESSSKKQKGLFDNNSLFDSTQTSAFTQASNRRKEANICALKVNGFNNEDESFEKILERRKRRGASENMNRVLSLITINIFRDWPNDSAIVNNYLEEVIDESDSDITVPETFEDAATCAVAHVVREMGIAILSSACETNPSVAKAAAASMASLPGAFLDGNGVMNNSERGGRSLFPTELMNELATKAKEIQQELCDRLDEVGQEWRAPTTLTKGGDSSSKASHSFTYHEVAGRCTGRLDARYRMEEAPFNHPQVINNPILLPVIQELLGGETATLVYAGLIFSFPHSEDQNWHMDGATLFPECRNWLELPPYALNVFIPLDDITDELGPTEFIPESHISSKQKEIDFNLSKMLLTKGDNEQWMDNNFVISPLLKRGDALIYDYRINHRGTRNLSDDRIRPMLYLIYARPWFKEHMNFGGEWLFPMKERSW